METLRKQLFAECDYRMTDETMDRFLGLMTEVKLKNGEPLIPYGKLDDNIYVVKEGIIRRVHFDGMKEKTFSFAAPGTMLISYYSFYMRTPSVFQLESCGESVIMKVSNVNFHELLLQSYDFAQWMLRMYPLQLYHWEMKASVINGMAKERLEALIKNRPQIIEKVSSNIIASYIGVTPQSLSRLKRELMAKHKKQ